MKIQFLGTCAADFSERLNADFAFCFDKDVRRSSALLINNELLIDCGPHTLDSLNIAGIPAHSIRGLLITHSHNDHYVSENVRILAKKAGHSIETAAPYELTDELSGIPGVSLIKSCYVETISVAGYEVTPLPANHGTPNPRHYAVSDGKKCLFYGCDGAWLLNMTNSWLQKHPADMAVLDGTVGDYEGDFRTYEHNSIPMLRMMIPPLREFGSLTPGSRVVISHLAPSLHRRPHEQIAEALRKDGIEAAYDGWITEI